MASPMETLVYGAGARRGAVYPPHVEKELSYPPCSAYRWTGERPCRLFYGNVVPVAGLCFLSRYIPVIHRQVQ